MKLPAAITVRDRFAPLRQELIAVLEGLNEQDWMRPTAAPAWSVKDVAAHLLGGDIGILSRERDGFRFAPVDPSTYRELVELVNQLNDEWTVAARRISPRLLCELLTLVGPKVEAYFSTLDLDALGGPVSWAGPIRLPCGSTSRVNIRSAGITSNRFAMRPIGPGFTIRITSRLCSTRSCARSPITFARQPLRPEQS